MSGQRGTGGCYCSASNLWPVFPCAVTLFQQVQVHAFLHELEKLASQVTVSASGAASGPMVGWQGGCKATHAGQLQPRSGSPLTQ